MTCYALLSKNDNHEINMSYFIYRLKMFKKKERKKYWRRNERRTGRVNDRTRWDWKYGIEWKDWGSNKAWNALDCVKDYGK